MLEDSVMMTLQTASALKELLACNAELIAGHSKPLRTTYDGARAETELALTASIQQLLDATRMHPHEVQQCPQGGFAISMAPLACLACLHSGSLS